MFVFQIGPVCSSDIPVTSLAILGSRFSPKCLFLSLVVLCWGRHPAVAGTLPGQWALLHGRLRCGSLVWATASQGLTRVSGEKRDQMHMVTPL